MCSGVPFLRLRSASTPFCNKHAIQRCVKFTTFATVDSIPSIPATGHRCTALAPPHERASCTGTWLGCHRAAGPFGFRTGQAARPRLDLIRRPWLRTFCTLGGRQIVHANEVDPADFFIKRITKDDVEFNFSRSQGAGGQNVNKVSTKADIRFDVKHCTWMSKRLKEAVYQREAGRMNKAGELLISSQVTRSQASNLSDALQRLQTLLDEASESIRPIISDPSKVNALKKRKEKADKKRIDKKKKHSDKKANRRVGRGDW